MGIFCSAATCAADTKAPEQPAPMIAAMPRPKAFLVRCSAPASVLNLCGGQKVVGDAIRLVVDILQRLVDAESGCPRQVGGVRARRRAEHGQQHADANHSHTWWCRLRRPAVVRRGVRQRRAGGPPTLRPAARRRRARRPRAGVHELLFDVHMVHQSVRDAHTPVAAVQPIGSGRRVVH
eukprot:7055903-Prymnesium_polylepis.1